MRSLSGCYNSVIVRLAQARRQVIGRKNQALEGAWSFQVVLSVICAQGENWMFLKSLGSTWY